MQPTAVNGKNLTMSSEVDATGIRPMRPVDPQAYVGTDRRPWYRDGWNWAFVGAMAVSGSVWATSGVDLSYAFVVACAVLLSAGVSEGARLSARRISLSLACVAVLVVVGAAVVDPPWTALTQADRLAQGLWGLLGAAAATGIVALRAKHAASRITRDERTPGVE